MSLSYEESPARFCEEAIKVSLHKPPEVEHRVQHLGERRHISRDINLELRRS
jgi:hypothetical protein